MAVTIRDIARESGYAVGTVSRVLNHHPDVSETARQRIMEVVEAHGFTPNSNARHLKQSVSRSVAIIVKGSSNLLFADMVERAQNCLQSRGFDTAVHYLDEDANEVAFAAIVAREYKPRGFLFLGGNLDCFRSDFAAISAPAPPKRSVLPKSPFFSGSLKSSFAFKSSSLMSSCCSVTSFRLKLSSSTMVLPLWGMASGQRSSLRSRSNFCFFSW